MIRLRSFTTLLALAAMFAASFAAPALGGLSDFKLARAIPADVFLAIHSRDHQGQEFLQKQLARVWTELEAQHLEQDIQKMFKGLMQEDAAASQAADTSQFDAQWQQISDRIGAIDWAALFGPENALAMKVEFPAVQFVLLTNPKEGQAQSVFDSLSALVKHLIGMAPPGKILLATEGDGAVVVHRVSFAEMPFPFGITLARHNEVVVVGMGSTLPEQALSLLRGESGPTLASTERFQAALKDLPAPEDSVTFFDADKMFKQMKGLLDQVMQQIPPDGGPTAEQRALPAKIMHELDLFDYVAGVSTTSGMQTTAESVAAVKADASGKMFYKAFFGGGTLDNPLKHVPKNAANFSAMAGLDLMALYRGALDFVKKEIPDGAAHIQEFETQKQNLPFDLEKDVLALIGGKFISFSMPGKSAYSPGDWVLMLSVKNAEHAKAKLDELVTFGEGMMKQQQMGTINAATLQHGANFRTVASPMLMMMPGMASPTFGIQGEWLILASAPKAIDTSLASAAGSEPNFSENERFQKEGVKLDVSGLCAASFSDMTKLGDELSAALGMLPMMGMMMQDIYKNPVGRTVMTIVPKLSKVAKKLDFYQSSSARTTTDGRVIRSLSVMNYREPPVATPPASESPSPAKQSE